MIINVLQHTPNEGPGTIQEWSINNGHQMYIYHPYFFNVLPSAKDTDMLIVLGGPMSPNDNKHWIEKERELINQLIEDHKPILGICYGAQQIVKSLGYQVLKSPVKEVGFDSIYLESKDLTDIPNELDVLNWHEEMFEVPAEAQLLFSSKGLKNQGFIMNNNIIGLQFHLEPTIDNLREIVINDRDYPIQNNVLK